MRNNYISEENEIRRVAPVTELQQLLKFFKSESHFQGQGHDLKIMLLHVKSSCHKEYTSAIWKPYLFWFESYVKVKAFLSTQPTHTPTPGGYDISSPVIHPSSLKMCFEISQSFWQQKSEQR